MIPTIMISDTKEVTNSGTKVQLSTTSEECIKIDIQAHENNVGTIVVGGINVVAALAGRKGIALRAGDVYSFDAVNLINIYIDSTNNGDKITLNKFRGG